MTSHFQELHLWLSCVLILSVCPFHPGPSFGPCPLPPHCQGKEICFHAIIKKVGNGSEAA